MKVCWGGEGAGSDEEDFHSRLEGGDGTGSVGEGGVEMGENVGRGRRLVGQRRRWAASEEGGADGALCVVEAFPDALPGAVAEMGVGGADGRGDAAGDGVLEEAPEGGGGETEASDLVGAPDAESASAAGLSTARAAKDASGAWRLSLGVAVVKAVQEAVANEQADTVAMGTGHEFEALGKGDPFVGVAVKASLLSHGYCSGKIQIVPEREGAG